MLSLSTPVIEEADKLNSSYEILFVNDGSSDGTEHELRKLAKAESNVKCIMFRNNFKKAAAYSAGLRFSKGEIIVTMDGDLHHSPEGIPRLIDEADEGNDEKADGLSNVVSFQRQAR